MTDVASDTIETSAGQVSEALDKLQAAVDAHMAKWRRADDLSDAVNHAIATIRSARTSPVAWMYETATGVDALRNWDGFQKRLSFHKPEEPPGSTGTLRNVVPLVPASPPPPQPGVRVTELWPEPSQAEREGGWTISTKYLAGVAKQALDESGYDATWEFTERVLLIAESRFRAALTASGEAKP